MNFMFLVLGILIGTVLSERSRPIMAQNPRSALGPPRYQEVQPEVQYRSAAFGVILAGHIASDDLMVKGTDLVKLYLDTVNLMARKNLISKDELQAVVDGARADPILRAKPDDAK